MDDAVGPAFWRFCSGTAYYLIGGNFAGFETYGKYDWFKFSPVILAYFLAGDDKRRNKRLFFK